MPFISLQQDLHCSSQCQASRGAEVILHGGVGHRSQKQRAHHRISHLSFQKLKIDDDSLNKCKKIFWPHAFQATKLKWTGLPWEKAVIVSTKLRSLTWSSTGPQLRSIRNHSGLSEESSNGDGNNLSCYLSSTVFCTSVLEFVGI